MEVRSSEASLWEEADTEAEAVRLAAEADSARSEVVHSEEEVPEDASENIVISN